MSEIQPFCGIHYAVRDGQRDISSRLAPPYDVLDAADKQHLLQRDEYNFVRIDLPHVPAKDAGPARVYEQAQRDLEDWLASGVLVRDDKPALYAYHQRFEHEGKTYTRRMFFARLRLEPFGQGSVFPHEQTFGGPKEDRLALTKATRCNLSPIFGLYSDPQNEVSRRLEAALPAEPLLEGQLDGTHNRVWAVTDASVIEDVRRLMAARPMYIADGHHRYGTALLYRDWLAKREGGLRDEHPANYVLCVLCAMEDPGLLILPTHRVLPEVGVDPTLLEGVPELECKPLQAGSADAVPQALVPFGPQAVALFCASEGAFHVVRPRKENLLDEVAPQRSKPWRRLGLAFLHAFVIERVIQPRLCNGRAPGIEYIKSAAAAVERANDSGGAAFLMQPTTMQELRDVCSAGDLMPQKSTFFYPKLASGLIVNPLY